MNIHDVYGVDNSSTPLVVRRSDYTLLNSLLSCVDVVYRHIPLTLSLNELSGDIAPRNLDYLEPIFLFSSFITDADEDNGQRVEVCVECDMLVKNKDR